MKFGGHETFYVRPGWLTKGLYRLNETETPGWSGIEAADTMGVGRNMSRSIGWWLKAAGMAEKRGRQEIITRFGRMILDHDPFLETIASWWFIHAQLAFTSPERVFNWFFGLHHATRFNREALEGALKNYLKGTLKRMPRENSVKRDINLLLGCYATELPEPIVDPEDNLDCPLRRLHLLVHRAEVGVFERRAPVSLPPSAAVAAILDQCSAPWGCGPMTDASLGYLGIGHRVGLVLGLANEPLMDSLEIACADLGEEYLSMRTQAGKRIASVRRLSLVDWYELHVSNAAKPARMPPHPVSEAV